MIKDLYLFLHKGFLILRLHHIQLGLLLVQLGLSFLQVHISDGQPAFLHHEISLEEKTKMESSESDRNSIIY